MSFDTREELIKSKAAIPGKSAMSELLKRVTSTDKDTRMPPQGDALSEKEIGVLRAWIDDGLPWEQGFSFKPSTYVAPLKPRKVTLPPAQPGREHPIDELSHHPLLFEDDVPHAAAVADGDAVALERAPHQPMQV